MSEVREPSALTGMEVAIIGMVGRFPGAGDVEEFWRNLRDGVDSLTPLDDAELLAAGADPALLRLPGYVKAARLMAGHDLFDAGFFGFSPREAELIDPQQRVFLECAWEALEDAGYDPEQVSRRTGVYAGSRMGGYLRNLYSSPAVLASASDLQIQVANDKDYLATRVSYKLNLGGPSVTVQTACSTALVALHFGCGALLAGECDLALAGGVGIRIPETGYPYVPGDVNSPDGRVRAFDARAQGTMFGSGMGIVVLKRLADAMADGDAIRAVVKGSAVSNDGSRKVGFTAPGVDGQTRVVRAALLAAEVDPETVTYVEAHGTGTPVGDPIEVAALTRAFRESTARKGFCALGSVKTNIGHLGAAAGAASLIKTVLALERRQIPASLHFSTPNPDIDFAGSPFFVNTELRPWTAEGGGPRRAGVSAFGMGGTNAHVILEEAPAADGPAPARPSRPWQQLLLSARTPAALEAATARLAAHLRSHPGVDLADAAYTLAVGRKTFEHRRAVLCDSVEEAIAALERLPAERVSTRAPAPPGGDGAPGPGGGTPSVAFLFSGQGAQHPAMGAELYAAEPTFRAEVDRCSTLLVSRLGRDLREELFARRRPAAAGAGAGADGEEQEAPAAAERSAAGGAEQVRAATAADGMVPRPEEPAEDAAGRLRQTALTQPALFVLEYALARLWMEWGVVPQAMLGHSIGEYVAATLAGVMALPDALALVAARGRLMQSLPGGAMLAVPLPEAEVAPLLGPQLALAAVNTPARTVVSGPEEAVASLARQLAARGLAVRQLQTSHAFHSPMMEPILAPFLRAVEQVPLAPPRIPFLSNVTGGWITPEEATDPGYWARHLRHPVRFSDGIGRLLEEPGRVLLEVGPGTSLAGMARQHPDRQPWQPALASLPGPRERRPETMVLLRALGELWLHGVACDWAGFYRHQRRRRCPLPTYPFERQRYWIEFDAAGGEAILGRRAVAKKQDVADWFYLPSWRSTLPPALDAGPGEPDQADGAGEPGAAWLIFADDCGLGARLAARLEAAGRPVTTVGRGARFERLGETAFRLAPADREGYDQLLRQLIAAGRAPRYVVHLWCVDRDAPPAPGAEFAGEPAGDGTGAAAAAGEGLDATAAAGNGSGAAAAAGADWQRLSDEIEERSFWSLLYLAQSCGRQGLTSPLSLLAVASGLQRVRGERGLCPEKATLLGPVLVIPREYPHISAACLDVELPAPGGLEDDELVALAARVAAEAAGPLADPVVALRGDERLARDYAPARLESLPPERLRLRQGGVYLITGGLGGIGLTFAELLAREYRARLVLLGITALPPRDEWDGWVAEHGERHRTSQRIRKVQELERDGAEVLVLACDVADPAQTRQAVAEARRRFGALHGVIHAAGLAGGGVIQLKAAQTAAAVLAPKRRGTRSLEAALAGAPLDFLVLCSSTIALAGGLGQVDYCAANNFLDAFAQAAAAAGATHTVSINWGAWEEVGMAVASGLMGGPAAEPTAPSAAERLDIHPLLDRCQRETAEEAVYETDFAAARHWPLAEHKILGRPALPGTSYLEMARAAFEHHAAAFEAQEAPAVELREVLFLTPLVLDDAESRTVRLALTREPDGYAFRMSSRLPGAGGERAAEGGEGARGEPAWQVHARGRVRGLAAAPPPPVDLAALRRRCAAREIVPEGPLMSAGEGPIFWGPRWQSLRKVEVGDGEWLATLELPEAFAGDLSRFALHPALLDVATGLIGFFEEGTHVPLSYRRVTLLRPLPPRLFSWFRRAGEGGAGKETVAVDVTLLDEQGVPVAEIERFVLKRIDAAAAFGRPAAPPAADTAAATAAAAPTVATTVVATAATAPGTAATAAAAAPPPPPPQFPGVAAAEGILSREGVEVLRRVLARGRRLPQVAASAKDLQALFAQVRELAQSGLTDKAGAAARGPAAARPTHPRPSLATPYAAPRNEVESRLATIFQGALGIEEVGVHDNFFDLGGDSMVGIQVVARANEMQLQLSPDQLFEHQTIAELAALLPGGAEPSAAAALPPPAPPWPPPPAAAPPPGAAGALPGTLPGTLPGALPGTLPAELPAAAFADSGLSAADLDKVLAKLSGAG
jgi:phthiocerol/phenolphthiocerol synthesis type-I polyketide synthase E